MLTIRVQTEDFALGDEYQQLCDIAGSAAGAVVTFTGRVRDFNPDSQVHGLFLEAYPGMTEKAMQQIAHEAQKRWSLQAISIVHRIGELQAGDQIVLVGVASGHRADAFAAAQFVMDVLKNRVPLWKKELTSNGDVWVEQKQTDVSAEQKW